MTRAQSVPDGNEAGCPIHPGTLGWVGPNAEHPFLFRPGLAAEGFVLAGGRSSRMGRDKALILFEGKPLIEHALGKLRALGLNPRIAGSRPDLASFAPIVEDLHPGCGPLSGIEAALERSQSELNVFLPVDLPLLPVDLLRWMLARATMTGAEATMPLLLGRSQPLCSVLRRHLLPGITGALDRGEFKVMDAFAATGTADLFHVEAVAPTQPAWPAEPPIHRWFQNLNVPQDLAALGLMKGADQMR